jgi:hypothetical protein
MKKIYFAVLTVIVLMFSGCAEMPIQNPALTMHNAAKAGNIGVVDSLLKQGHNEPTAQSQLTQISHFLNISNV